MLSEFVSQRWAGGGGIFSAPEDSGFQILTFRQLHSIIPRAAVTSGRHIPWGLTHLASSEQEEPEPTSVLLSVPLSHVSFLAFIFSLFILVENHKSSLISLSQPMGRFLQRGMMRTDVRFFQKRL